VTARGTIGAISVLNRDVAFTDEDARVLKRLSDQVSVAIVNARLFEEVERATREWKVAFDAIASGMVVLDDRGIVKRCNARAAELTNCGSIVDLLGQPFSIALLGVESNDTGIEALLRDGSDSGAMRATLRDEKRGRLIDLTICPHPDGGSVATFDDVTEVHGLAERHRCVLEMASEAIIITDINRRVAYANPAAHTLFNSESLIGAATIDLIPSDAHDQLLSAESAAMSGKVQRYELPIIRADGQLRQVAVSSSPLLEIGQITGTVACLRDVTDMHAGALALERSEARYTRLVESASDAIFTVDAEGRFTSVNASLLEATGRTRDSLLGDHCLSVVDPRDRQIAQGALDAVFRGERHKVQLRYYGPHGSIRVGALLVAPVMEGDAYVGGLAVVRDITDEEMERGARIQEQQLASMGRVLGGVANELNNPLSSLLAVAELHSASASLSSSDRVALEQIREEARRASRIVKHLFGVSGGALSDRTTVDLNRLVRETLDLHGYSLREKHIPVRLDLGTSEPAVRGNRARLQQVLLNLLKNAEEALSTWNGVREVLLQTLIADGKALLIVSDSGPGIPADIAPRIFEPMFTTQTDNQMRGLGLAVTAAVVNEHGGSIDVVASPGDGARFVVSLPLVMQAAESATDPDMVGMSVLVVEDEATLRSAVQRYLIRQGIAVTVADSGAEALSALDSHQYDVVLLDVRMFGMQGDEVYRTLAKRNPEQARRVIFVTGDMHNSDIAGFIDSTGRPAIAKPFQLSELLERIQEHAAATRQ
jgi:PAS domain S-box-containing protein